jgi:hypothetical protein
MFHSHYHNRYTDEEECLDTIWPYEAAIERLTTWQIPEMIEGHIKDKEDDCWIITELSYEFSSSSSVSTC